MKNIITLIALISLNYATNAQTDTNDQVGLISQYQESIVGEWLLENDSNTKYVFAETGEVRIYLAGILDEISTYDITAECGDIEHSDPEIFLSIINSSQSISCSYLETLDYEGGGKMTLLTDNQGKVIVFLKQ